MSNASWIALDKQWLRTRMNTWSATPVAHPRRPFDEPPQSGTSSAPAIFLAYMIRRGTILRASDPDDPARTLIVRVLFYVEQVSGVGGVLEPMYQQVVDTIDGDSGAHVSVIYSEPIELGEVTRHATRTAWWVEGLDITCKV